MSEDNFIDSERNRKNEEIRKENERLQRRLEDDIRKVVSMKEGRRFVRWILSEAGVWRTSFTLNSNQTAFNEGKRDMGLALLTFLNKANPEAYAQMQREHLSELYSKENKE